MHALAPPQNYSIRVRLPDKSETQPIAVEDLLGRPQTTLDRDMMQSLVGSKNILVTGSGGSIGSELVRQTITLKPSITLYDNSEFQLYQSTKKWLRHSGYTALYGAGERRDETRIEQVL